jgi:molybdate transport system regulatory protein
MNKLFGKITNIVSYEGISIVSIQTKETTIKTILLDTPSSCDYLKLDEAITIVFKETEVAVALTNLGSISMANQIKCKIDSVKNGKILSNIHLTCGDTKIVSIITTDSSKRLRLQKGQEVIALIKANEISLMQA